MKTKELDGLTAIKLKEWNAHALIRLHGAPLLAPGEKQLHALNSKCVLYTQHSWGLMATIGQYHNDKTEVYPYAVAISTQALCVTDYQDRVITHKEEEK